jgi:hypothetical protein
MATELYAYICVARSKGFEPSPHGLERQCPVHWTTSAESRRRVALHLRGFADRVIRWNTSTNCLSRRAAPVLGTLKALPMPNRTSRCPFEQGPAHALPGPRNVNGLPIPIHHQSRRRESNASDSRWQRDASPVGLACIGSEFRLSPFASEQPRVLCAGAHTTQRAQPHPRGAEGIKDCSLHRITSSSLFVQSCGLEVCGGGESRTPVRNYFSAIVYVRSGSPESRGVARLSGLPVFSDSLTCDPKAIPRRSSFRWLTPHDACSP